MTTSLTPIQRAKAGAARLDRVMPGWYRKIKITKLDMSSGFYDPRVTYSSCGCIMAQLDYETEADGVYARGIRRILRIMPFGKKAQELGFMASDDDPDDYVKLARAWKDEIRARKQVDLA